MAETTRVRGYARAVAVFVAGLIEVGLALSGLWFTLWGSEDDDVIAVFLFTWGSIVTIYLFIGGLRVRKRAMADVDAPAPSVPTWSTIFVSRRFSFMLTVAASLTGLTAALDALRTPDRTREGLVVGLSAFVMICAWMLLHLGYARFYSKWTQWRFPKTEHPQLGDFLYFAVTVGVSFAASDVEVQSHRLRWHVLVHSVISFFYNAIVLAVAVSIITRK